MALHGCQLIGILEPEEEDRKSILVWAEIDRCVTDAVTAVTGVRLGKRTLKFVDYGKVAATFYNTQTGQAVRLAALDESRGRADQLFPGIINRRERQVLAYQKMKPEELFKEEFVTVKYNKMDAPGRPLSRVACCKCAESINDGREIMIGRRAYCQACAHGGYYTVTRAGSDKSLCSER